MRCASRGLSQFVSRGTAALRPFLLTTSPTFTSRRAQGSPTLATSSASFAHDDMTSFEAEGELAELRREAARAMRQAPLAPHGAARASTGPASSLARPTSSGAAPTEGERRTRAVRPTRAAVSPRPTTAPRAEPVQTSRWRVASGQRPRFDDGQPEYARDSIAFLHAVLPLPFESCVEQLARCHVESLLVMLDYVAQCRSTATSFVECKAGWCKVERACWAALVLADARAPATLTSKHLAHAAQSVAHTLSASSGPAALPFLVLCYRHRHSLRRLQNVQVLDALLRVPPPDSFVFAESDVLSVAATMLYEAVLAHLLWRCVMLSDKDLVAPRMSARRRPRPSPPATVLGGFQVVQLVEQALLWRAKHVPDVLRKAAVIWVQKHTPSRAPSSSRAAPADTTFQMVLRDPILGPKPTSAAEREERQRTAAETFDALKQLVARTDHFTVPVMEAPPSAESQRRFEEALISELARTPTFARRRHRPSPPPPPSAHGSPATALDESASLLLVDEDAAWAELRAVVRLLAVSDGVARRDLLSTAQTLILHTTALSRLVRLLDSGAVGARTAAAVLQPWLVLQCLRAVPYAEAVPPPSAHTSASRHLTLAALTSVVVQHVAHAGVLAVVRAAVHALPHWGSLDREMHVARRMALVEALVSRLVYVVPVSLIPVVLTQRVQDGELAAFQTPPIVARLVQLLVDRVRTGELDGRVRHTTVVHTEEEGDPVIIALDRLAQQAHQQAPLQLRDEAALPVTTGTAGTAPIRTVTSPSSVVTALVVSAAEQAQRDAGWRRLARLAQLSHSLAEEVELWQRLSHGRFHVAAGSEAVVGRTEVNAFRDDADDLAHVFAAHWLVKAPYVQTLLQRVQGRLLVRYATALVTFVTDAQAELRPVNRRFSALQQKLATTTAATGDQPWAALLFTYSMLLACGRRPVFASVVDAVSGGRVLALQACPLRPAADSQATESADLIGLATACQVSLTSATTPVSPTDTAVMLLTAMPAVRACFTALKDALTSTTGTSKMAAMVLWCAAQAQLWCTLATLYLVALPSAAHRARHADTASTALALTALYQDALTTLLHLATHPPSAAPAALPILSLMKALPDTVALPDIFTAALHRDVFQAARAQLTPMELARLGELAVTVTSTDALSLPALPVDVVQMVVRRCVMSGVEVPLAVRHAVERAKQRRET